MLENCRNARERWGGVSELIDRWLKERQELLVHYCELSVQHFSTNSARSGTSLTLLPRWFLVFEFNCGLIQAQRQSGPEIHRETQPITSDLVPQHKKCDHCESVDTEKTDRASMQKCKFFLHLWARIVD